MALVCLRDLTADEFATVKRLAHSHAAPAQRVHRAQIIWRASRGESAAEIAARVGLDGETVFKRIRRFNAEGLDALKDRDRSGRPPTSTLEQTATVIDIALTKPQALGLPFAALTLDRLAAYLHERKVPHEQPRALRSVACDPHRRAACQNGIMYPHAPKGTPVALPSQYCFMNCWRPT